MSNEPVLVDCQYCHGKHERGQVVHCPLNPDKAQRAYISYQNLKYGSWVTVREHYLNMSCPNCLNGTIHARWLEGDTPHLKCAECGSKFTITIEKETGKP